MRDSKKKAEKLLKAINANLGQVIRVNENIRDELTYYMERYYADLLNSDKMLRGEYKVSNQFIGDLNYKKVKIISSVRVKYEIE